MTVGVVLLVVLVMLAVLYVVVPLVRTTAPEAWKTASDQQLRLVELRERRDAALVSLRELELDHETGKLDDRDYAIANDELRAEALAALAALDDDVDGIMDEPAATPPVKSPPPAAPGPASTPEPATDRRADS